MSYGLKLYLGDSPTTLGSCPIEEMKNNTKPAIIAAPETRKAVVGLYACHKYPPPIPAIKAPRPTAAFNRPSALPRSCCADNWEARDRWTPSVSAGNRPSSKKLPASIH